MDRHIYHFTCTDNLVGIVARGLECSKLLHAREATFTNISFPDVQALRATKRVMTPSGGTLHDYVPFYFAPRSPMLYTIKRGNVGAFRNRSQEELVYLVTTAHTIREAGIPFAFTDRHAVHVLANYHANLAHLDKIDWPLMSATMWSDTKEDPSRMARRMAEFLVYGRVPWSLITEVVTMTPQAARRVASIVHGGPVEKRVSVKPGWYY
ncbi:type II toxin-antitoxin system toxin DNA ADP-ribosyl transferase DarT [Chondromyces crocatus]|uniref:DarT domain-containing protein n=1 Tax=Chondromyces crocatus TaxID=52 RepID=A0A0K1EB01_CHOCO|nr:DUF4433 domain-containing protein [Chondromyces crocatus]AKT38045.1 uncharacterized protein CMC5_021860 [Chondromyces crocatus]